MSINRTGRLQPDAARRSAPLRAPTPYSCPATNTRMRELTSEGCYIDFGNRKADRGAARNKNFLQSEADRIERETARYMNLTQMASASVKIIFDTVSRWRQADHPMREFEIMRSQAKDSTGRMEHPSIKGRNADSVLTGRSRPKGARRACRAAGCSYESNAGARAGSAGAHCMLRSHPASTPADGTAAP